ncbi:tRNA methyltransferase 10 homolog A-like [Oculina patagonica]
MVNLSSIIVKSFTQSTYFRSMEDDNAGKQEQAEQQTMSKRQRKRLMKHQLFVEQRKIKRKEKKERKKAQKRKLQEEGETEDGQAATSGGSFAEKSTFEKKIKLMSSKDASPLRIAIDLSFDDLMNDRDIHKLLKQIQRTYSINRRAKHPVQLFLTSFGGRSKTILEEIKCNYGNWDVHIKTEPYSDVFSQEDVVYLTSDSPNVLSEIDESKAYIIGGLVDHNHHKGLCYELAVQRGINHAQLPITEFVKLKSRKVITVNQVFEILLQFTETKDWKEAFFNVLPARKMEEDSESKEADNETKDGAENGSSSEVESKESDEGNDDQVKPE